MQPPDELMVGTFLPSMRQLVARRLRDGGFSQSKISSMLGITQASVSLYLSSSAEKAYSSLASLSVPRDEADRYAALLAEDVKRSPLYGVETLHSVWNSLLGGGQVCAEHRKMYPALADCDVCIRAYGGGTGDRSGGVSMMKEAVRILEGAREFVDVMPEVSVNVAYLPLDSTDMKDVIAVPGRIVKVKGSAKSTLPPEFGASGHMARVLLLARKRMVGVRAVINLRYDGKIEKVLKRMGLRSLRIGEYSQVGRSDPTVEALAAAMVRDKRQFDVVVDTGGKGIEPNIYLFGKEPLEVARLAERVARLYSSV
jgi:predicted fused transcriptional regulator/phosphomethylpyrimidine kinase/predicted transcriptional regulator